MRIWLAGLCVGLLLASAAPELSPGLALAAAAVLFAFALLPALPAGRAWLFGGGIALGLLVGIGYAVETAGRRLPLDCVGQTLTVTGAITGLPEVGKLEDGTPRSRFRFVPERVTPSRCAGPERVLLSYYGDARLAPGQRWQLEVRLRRPWGPGNPGLADRRAWFASVGVDAQGSVRSRPEPGPLAPSRSWLAAIDRLRAELSSAIEAQPQAPATRAVLRALTVGDKAAIDARLWRRFQEWGIAHLLVISGLHIGLAAAFGYGAARLLLFLVPSLGTRAPLVSGLAVATLYAALAGFTVPVQRSLVMLAVYCVAGVLARPSGGWHKLLLAAVVVLLFNPLAAIGVGFWLSFGAVACLLWLATWQSRGGLRVALKTHLAMGVCMLPLGAYFFQGASLIAPLANLLLVPLVGLWVVPAALLAAVTQLLWPSGAGLTWSLAAWPLGHLLRFMLAAEEHLQGRLYLQAVAGVGALCLGLAGIALAWVPGGWRHRLVGLAAVAATALPLLAVHGAADDALRVVVLDVGQGTAVLFTQGDRALLYDTGGGDPLGQNAARTVVLPSLRLRGIRSLDTFVISHGDRDHAAGVADVLAELPVARIRHGPLVELEQGRACAAGEAWRWPGGARFRLLSPVPGDQSRSNDSSCVLQVQWAGHTLLLPGDIERAQERQLAAYWRDELAAQWLLAPHHGSNTSSSHGFLKYVRPAHLLVGNGYQNRFGHPHPAVLARASQHDAQVHETARRGAISLTLHADGREQWQFYRDLYRPHWAQPLHRVLRAGL